MRLAIQSFDCVAQEQRDALQELLKKRLKRPACKRLEGEKLICSAFPEVITTQTNETSAAVKEMKRFFGMANAYSKEELAQRVYDEVYPVGKWEKAVHSVGQRVGAAGPEQSTRGGYRFVLETPILTLLVQATLSEEENKAGVLFDKWIDRVFDQFGIVLGKGTQPRIVDLMTRLQSKELVLDLLKENQKLLRERMLRGGLAVEFSDGQTVVMLNTTQRQPEGESDA